MEDPGRLSELQYLNRIQESLLVEPPSSKEDKEPPTMTATTRSKTRRVQFADQPIREQLDIPSCARTHQDKNDQAPELLERADMRKEFEKTTRRSEIERVPKPSTEALRRREPLNIQDIDPLVVQAERRERISKALDEED